VDFVFTYRFRLIMEPSRLGLNALKNSGICLPSKTGLSPSGRVFLSGKRFSIYENYAQGNRLFLSAGFLRLIRLPEPMWNYNWRFA